MALSPRDTVCVHADHIRLGRGGAVQPRCRDLALGSAISNRIFVFYGFHRFDPIGIRLAEFVIGRLRRRAAPSNQSGKMVNLPMPATPRSNRSALDSVCIGTLLESPTSGSRKKTFVDSEPCAYLCEKCGLARYQRMNRKHALRIGPGFATGPARVVRQRGKALKIVFVTVLGVNAFAAME